MTRLTKRQFRHPVNPVKIELKDYVALARCSSSTAKCWDRLGVTVMLGSAGNAFERTPIASVELAALGLDVFGARGLYTGLKELLDKKLSENATHAAVTTLVLECVLLDLGWTGLVDALITARNAAVKEAHLEGQQYARALLRDWLFADYNVDQDAAEDFIK